MGLPLMLKGYQAAGQAQIDFKDRDEADPHRIAVVAIQCPYR